MDSVETGFLINKVLNKSNAKYTMILMTIFVFYVIIEHIFHLTKSVYAYNYSMDYGSYLKNVCGNKEFFEYETSRFQFADNANDIKIENDNNKNQYMTFILVISIIISLFISSVFTYLVYNTFINTSFIYNLAGLEKYACTESAATNSIKYIFTYMQCIVIQLFVDPIRISYSLIRKLLFDEILSPTMILKNLLFLLYLFIAYVVMAVVLVIMPVYIGLILNNGFDISPFNLKSEIYGGYIALFVLLILMRFLYFLFYNYFETDVSSYVLTEYFSDNVKKLYTTNKISGVIAYFVFLAIYIVMFFILGNIINLYKNNELGIESKDNAEDNININIRQNIFDGFMNSVLGYKEFNNFEVPNIFVKNMSGITFILFITICVIIGCLFMCNMLGMLPNIYKLLVYGIIVPLLILFIILFLTKNTTEYNTYFNKYIVVEPARLYKQYMNKIHTIFNKCIQRDYRDMNLASGYVCRNIGNAILLTLYSDVFAGLDKVNRNSVPVENAYIDMTPEFKYDKLCNNAVPFHFTNKQNKEYNIEYYLNGKDHNKNIMYTFNDCSAVNMDALSAIGRNMVKMFNSDNLKIIMKQIFEKFYVSETAVVKTTQPMQYIKQEIINKSENAKIDLQNYMKKLKKQIHQSISNVYNQRVYNNLNEYYIYYVEETKQYNKNNQLLTLMDIEVNQYNNKLDADLKPISQESIKTYDLIVNKIVDVYMDLIYAHLYVFAPIYTYVSLSNSDDNYRVYQNEYVQSMNKYLIETFDNINKELSYPIDKLKNDVLTKYVINNYNTMHMEQIYTKNVFDAIIHNANTVVSNKAIENDTKVYYKYLKDLLEIFENIKQLNKMFITYKQNDITFISLLSDSKNKIRMYMTNFNDYVERRKLQDSDVDPELFIKNINMIFRAEDARYHFSYLIYKISKETITQDAVIIDKNIYSMTNQMMRLSLIILNDIESMQNAINKYMTFDYSSSPEQSKTYKLQNQYKSNIEYYVDILKKNLNSLNNDYVYYSQSITIDTQITDEDMSIDLSRNITKEACETDKMIYLVLINYIIAILSVNLIMI
jgi:hypothetical protein